MHLKTYVGRRESSRCSVVVVRPGRTTIALSNPLGLRRHSPTGFEWGYGGSGPAQLALALLADATDSATLALDHYQDYKVAVVSQLPRQGWTLTQDQILDWLADRLASPST